VTAMHAASVIAAVLVGVVFLTSAVTKFASPIVWRTQAADLGVPRSVVVALPIVEAGLGALLVVQWQRRICAGVALGLLLAFTAMLVVRISQGRRPPCACFGSFSAKPISWMHVARNVGFIVVAAVALAAG
jgi:uncharacterized membrane protein YphA (DoxX/SURF4 family)